MITRYTRPEMKVVWAPRQKFQLWLEVELAVLKVKWQLGQITKQQYLEIKKAANFTLKRITVLDEGPNGFRHDMLAFVETIKERMRAKNVPEETIGLFHKDVTSYDIEDNALSLQLQAACRPIRQMLREARNALYERALEHKMTPVVALTHGQAAELTSLGKRLLDYVDLLDQHIERLTQTLDDVRVGRLAGAVGTYGHLGPEFEQQVCAVLGLKPVLISTQIVNRSRFADLFNALALLASDIGHIAEGMWQMASFPRMEMREPFRKGQRGSSQMPHKKNPIVLERLRGLAVMVRGYQSMIMETVATRDERAIDQSCVERIVWPDGTTVIHYMLYLLRGVAKSAEFFPEQMQANIDQTRGMLSSGFVKDLLLDNGVTMLPYDGEDLETYVFIQSCAFEAWGKQIHLLDVLRERGVLDRVPSDELEACFDNGQFLAYIDPIFDRFEPLAEAA